MEPITGIQIAFGIIALLLVTVIIIKNKHWQEHVSQAEDTHVKASRHELAFYPINEQVQFAQKSLKAKIDDYLYIKAYLDSAELDTMGDFAIETIGNLAYIALFYKGKECREAANSYLSAYKSWIKINFPSDYEAYVQAHGDSRN